jgi:hypothetical protein
MDVGDGQICSIIEIVVAPIVHCNPFGGIKVILSMV